MLGDQNSYQFLADAPIACHEIDCSGRIVYVNAAECRLLGHEENEILGRTVWDFVAPEEQETSHEAVLLKIAGKQPLVRFEREYARPDGELLALEIHEKHVRDANQNIVGIRSFLIDITQRKRTEQALQVNQKRYQHLMEHASDIVYGTDEHGRFIFFNPAAPALLGYSPEQLIGRYYLELVRPDFRPEARRFYRNQLAKNIGDTYFEFPALAHDGTEVWFGQNVQLIKEGNRNIGFQAITRDITKQRRSEAEEKHAREELELRVKERTAELEMSNELLLREMEERRKAEEQRKRLEAQIQHAQRLESLGVLAGGIAHDFNNLLTAIMGHASMACLFLSEQSPARASIDAVLAASKNAAQLTKQMLAYSGRGKFVISPINLSQIVEDTSRFAASLLSKKATLTFNLAREISLIQADAAQIGQVLINLMTNASEALGDRTGSIRVSTGAIWARDNEFAVVGSESMLPAGHYIFLEVADTGCGMSKDTLARIFDPFFTTKFTGRGLGLAAVLGIVRGHGGTLEVETEQGRGSRFRVLFPASAAPDPPVSLPAESERTEWHAHGSVLVVDDETAVRELAAEILRRRGLTVITAVDGDDALRQFKANLDKIRAVLLDMTMPGFNGIEVFQQMAQIKSGVKVFLCSGYNMQDLDRTILPGGLAGFLRKPYLPEELIRCIRSAFTDPD